MYYLFRQLSTRAVLFDEVSTALEAQNYLQKFKNGFVVDDDDNVYKTKEELENAKDFRPEPRVEYDKFFTRGGEVSEDSDRELSESDTDNSESSSERDN